MRGRGTNYKIYLTLTTKMNELILKYIVVWPLSTPPHQHQSAKYTQNHLQILYVQQLLSG
jgi:hypothetical protein